MGKLLNDDVHYITTCPNFKRVRVIITRCETSSYEVFNVSLKERKPYKAPVADTISKEKTSDYELFR
jgi:C4-type Zn-finger protein